MTAIELLLYAIYLGGIFATSLLIVRLHGHRLSALDTIEQASFAMTWPISLPALAVITLVGRFVRGPHL